MPPRHALPALTDDLTWTLIIAATLALGLPLLIAASHFVMNCQDHNGWLTTAPSTPEHRDNPLGRVDKRLHGNTEGRRTLQNCTRRNDLRTSLGREE